MERCRDPASAATLARVAPGAGNRALRAAAGGGIDVGAVVAKARELGVMGWVRPTGELHAAPTNAQLLGIGALAAWMVAAALYVVVIGAVRLRSTAPDAIKEYGHVDEFIDAVLDDAAESEQRVSHGARYAHGAAAVAMALTVATVAAALLGGPAKEQRAAVVNFIASANGTVNTICDRTVKALRVTVSDEALTQPLVRMEVKAGECRKSKLTLVVPRSAIAAFTR